MKTKEEKEGENKEGGCIWLREKYGLKLIKFQKEREWKKTRSLTKTQTQQILSLYNHYKIIIKDI